MNPLEIVLLIIVIFSLTFMLLFYLRSERALDKAIEAEDELLLTKNSANYFTIRHLLKSDELSFYRVLQRSIGHNYYLLPQIHLSDLLYVKNDVRDHEHLYQKLGHRSVDYVVFSMDMTPRVAIELNGGSHTMPHRKNRDRAVEALLEKAGIKLIIVDKTESIVVADLVKTIQKILT